MFLRGLQAVFSFFFILLSLGLIAQNRLIKGKLTNAVNADPLAYAEVYLVLKDGSKQSNTSNFDGFYMFQTQSPVDSIVIKLNNFQKESRYIGGENLSEYNIALSPEKHIAPIRQKNIQGVVIKKKKKNYSNPAYEILERVVAKKPLNNPEKFQTYSYENYSRMEIAMSNFGEKFQKRKVYKDVKKILDQSSELADEKGNIPLPIFISENISDFYHQKDPKKTAEVIKKTKVEGIGIEDGSVFSQILSSTFIKYNFYNNYIRILGKDFLSPLNDNFKIQYDYELVDKRKEIDGESYYLLKFKPTRSSDLAFEGTVLIEHGTYALFRIDVAMLPTANLNFIKNLKIQQEMTKLPDEGNWLPGKTRVFVETVKAGKQSLSVFLKYLSSSKNMKINEKIDESIFTKDIKILKDAENSDEAYWSKNRFDSLSTGEKKMFAVIQSVKKLPSVRTYLDVIDLLLNGYYKVGKISLGPFLHTVGYNNYEGFRMRFGFKTNQDFSKKWILGGYLSYGFLDKQFKYNASVDYIISREPWVQTGVSYTHDLGQVAFQYEDFSNRQNFIFDSFTRNGRMLLRKPFWKDDYQAYLKADLLQSFTAKVTFRHFDFYPLFPYDYKKEPQSPKSKGFEASELSLEALWKPGRKLINTSANKQIQMKDNVYQPSITLRYTRGMKGVLGSDFTYNKFHLNIQQSVPMGLLGRGEYSLTGGYIPNKVPFPLLENHLGNEFVFFNRFAFNMMRFFEFTSNKYISLQYTQNLEGLITNSLPIIKKWNWRNHVTFNYLMGSLDPSFVKNTYPNTPIFRSLDGKPYMEFGYGFSNIFRFLRIDFIHRLTHFEEVRGQRPPAPKFSVKISAQIRL